MGGETLNMAARSLELREAGVEHRDHAAVGVEYGSGVRRPGRKEHRRARQVNLVERAVRLARRASASISGTENGSRSMVTRLSE